MCHPLFARRCQGWLRDRSTGRLFFSSFWLLKASKDHGQSRSNPLHTLINFPPYSENDKRLQKLKFAPKVHSRNREKRIQKKLACKSRSHDQCSCHPSHNHPFFARMHGYIPLTTRVDGWIGKAGIEAVTITASRSSITTHKLSMHFLLPISFAQARGGQIDD